MTTLTKYETHINEFETDLTPYYLGTMSITGDIEEELLDIAHLYVENEEMDENYYSPMQEMM